MSTEMPVTEMPVVEITPTIVNAARRVRNPKPVVEVSIVDEIIANLRENKFSEEACENLKRIFGRDFCVEKGLLFPFIEEASPVVTETTAKKPRAKKATAPADPVVETTSVETTEPVVEAPKVKKPRAKKTTPQVETTQVVETTSVETTSVETTEPVVKEKKPRAKKAPAATPLADPVVETTSVETTEPVVKEKKPRAKKAVIVQEKETALVVAEKKPTKKPRTKKTDTVITTGDVKVEETKTPLLIVEETVLNKTLDEFELPDLNERLGDGFTENWSDELMEEELSDIEEEDDE